ncbi:MAG: LAGLIDADG family homing endonuclease [Candidatus Helarchaeota archaeon]
MNLNELKKQALVFDIETSAHYPDGHEISIQSKFDDYVSYAKVKWFGAYSYLHDRGYVLDLNKQRSIETIINLFNEHNILVGFNSEDFDFPILKNNGLVNSEKYYTQIDCMKILGKSIYKDKNGFKYKDRGTLMNYKFKKKSLKAMAEEMDLETQKGDIDYKIFQRNIWTAEEKEEIKKYLKADVLVTKQMFEKLWEYWKPFTEMLDEKHIKNLSWIRNSIASLTYKCACILMGVEPTYSEKKSKKEEMGGSVLLPKVEEATNVWYIDFASLYPHVMTQFNLFAETCDTEGDFIWHGNDLFKVKGYYNISKPHPLNIQVQNKLKERINLKKNDPKNPMIYCLKIFLNALYGAGRSSIFEQIHTPNFGWDVCYLGQQIQKLTKDMMDEFGFESIYGDTDSCRKDTPITIKRKNSIEIIPIEDLINAPLTTTVSKENIEHKNIEIWTDKGWSKIKYVYRHKCNKKMFRILTRKGYVEVSKDHSLVINDKSVKPSNLNVGDDIELYPNILPEKHIVDSDLSWLIGFWLAEGSCGDYRKTCGKISWHLDNQKINLLKKSQNILKRIGIETKIIDCKKSSSTYRLVSDGDCFLLYKLFSNWCLSKSGIKKIPSFILESNKKAKKSFLKGYCDGDGHIDKKDNSIIFTSIDKPLLKGVTDIIHSLKKDYTLKIRKDKTNVIAVRILKNKNDKRINKANKILKIEEFDISENIYDIETKNHHFCGGFGNINLHNSLMCIAKDEQFNNKEYVQDCLNKIIKKIKDNVPFPVDTFSIDIEGFLPYIMFPFSEQPIQDEKGNNIKNGNKVVKERKGRKKNYLYLTEKNEIKLIGLPIKKDNATALGLKIYNDVLKPQILKNKCAKFSKNYIKDLINQYLKDKNIMKLMAREFKVKPVKTYKLESQLQAQISKHYCNNEDGIVYLIKNQKVGKVGKGSKYCTIKEAIDAKLDADDLDLEKIWNELEVFVKYEESLDN